MSLAWIASIAVGVVGLVAAVGLRSALGTTAAGMFVTIPLLALVMALASVAARNAPLARGWRDERAASAWIASLLAAALVASAAVVLLDVAGALVAERQGFSAVAGESVTASQKARVVEEMLHDRHAWWVLAWVDGFFAFATVASGLGSAIGPGPDGRVRSPLGAISLVAFGSVVAIMTSVFGVRAWMFHAVEDLGPKNQASFGFVSNL